MQSTTHLVRKLDWLYATLRFFRKHLAVIMSLGLVAGLGRVVQLGGFGEIPAWMNVMVEILVESSRLLLFLYVLGFASATTGALRVKHFLLHKKDRSHYWRVALQRLRQNGLSILLNIIVFAFIAWGINYLIDLLAYETCLYLTLKQDGILTDSSSEWTILLFFKNLSVIPFTLVFNAVFLLWITGKLRNYIPPIPNGKFD
ncbi:hypothetical protein [Nibrella saemangeumensis]|uniref:hypothetical protein n=1 Tax=Nibrella saemangeumensis TaxID=1084526 RepID=UPI0031E92371